MMEKLLLQLVQDARMEKAVAGVTLDNGMHLFAYPQEQGMLIAIGIGSGGHVQGESLLRKRSKNMQRFGAWLPAQFNDGSWYVIRRASDDDGDAPVISEDEFIAAEELLT